MLRGKPPGWPVYIKGVRTAAGQVGLRPIRLRDAAAWSRQRIENRTRLLPWEPTITEPWAQRHAVAAWPTMFAVLRSEARRGAMMPFVIEVDGRYAGQLTIGTIQRGALRSAWIGYWVDGAVEGRGVATAAVALGVDHAFGAGKLHRLEATVQEGNVASRGVLDKAGFRQEGFLRRYMDVNGAWRDHLLYALTVEDVGGSAVERLIREGRASY